jgi:hypothetical protein
MTTAEPLDVAIVGGGIAGIVHLHYARQAGLSALVLEKSAGVGGLWRELPAWQDIQITPADWNLGDLPMDGTFQPHVLANIEAWVSQFELADGIQLNSPVTQARHDGDSWVLETPRGPVRARHLVAATGGHNRPVIPAIKRNAASDGHGVRELHSSALHDPGEITGRDVVVVGGGASAFDLLDLCLRHRARRIVWVYRSLRWFTPTLKPKSIAGSVRPYAKMQVSGMSPEQQNRTLQTDLLARYERFGLQAIQPERPLDVRRDQLIPGRAQMLANFDQLERRPGDVVAIEGSEVTLSDGSQLTADLLLWGTGYETDLSYFDDPHISSVLNLNRLSQRCTDVFRSQDAPNLYFPSVVLDGIGAAPWSYALIARATMLHIQGRAQLNAAPAGCRMNYLELAQFLAQREPGNYADGDHGDIYRRMAMSVPDDQPFPLP